MKRLKRADGVDDDEEEVEDEADDDDENVGDEDDEGDGEDEDEVKRDDGLRYLADVAAKEKVKAREARKEGTDRSRHTQHAR